MLRFAESLVISGFASAEKWLLCKSGLSVNGSRDLLVKVCDVGLESVQNGRLSAIRGRDRSIVAMPAGCVTSGIQGSLISYSSW